MAIIDLFFSLVKERFINRLFRKQLINNLLFLNLLKMMYI
ncbi:hypothetical protein ADICYQ_0490 [Cyclobacterium qasimii M12-11B]|uniref:Uncharacterized protein n=1 Tax=Cyclobacterium qasimii M12-11B TaxID=641524 RepID=S7VPX8_9BACT|nr:hypothetical protein ADICYQ_0490 [Cyclobacterium qasimii M12-11B]